MKKKTCNDNTDNTIKSFLFLFLCILLIDKLKSSLVKNKICVCLCRPFANEGLVKVHNMYLYIYIYFDSVLFRL